MIERKPGTPVKASTEVENKNRPSVVTTINDKDLQAGDEVYDNFTVKGLVGDDTVDVNHELYWSPIPVEQSAEKPDRKSTRLNSSHVSISYAVFCLKKKNRPLPPRRDTRNTSQ